MWFAVKISLYIIIICDKIIFRILIGVFKLKKVEIFTDGACSGNPGPGGWGAILRYNSHEKEISGSEPETTNNRMELTAVIKALECLKEACEITIYTDSSYICKAFTEGWLERWILKSWKKADGKPVLNVDLWQKLIDLLKSHKYTFEWIKGHDGHPENERCDALAVGEYQKYLGV